MNALTRNKRNQVILLVLLILGALAGLWFGLIQAQQRSLANLAHQRAEASGRLRKVKEVMARADQVENVLTEQSNRLARIEVGMAQGDLYSWMINTIRQFKLPYKVDVPSFSQIDGPKEMSMLAGFPYKQATITVSGSACYYDFGRFLADFENQFPYMRIVNLTLEPVSGAAEAEKDRLAFRMEIATLVKPPAS